MQHLQSDLSRAFRMPSESGGLDQSWDVLIDGIEANVVNLGPVANGAMTCHCYDM